MNNLISNFGIIGIILFLVFLLIPIVFKELVVKLNKKQLIIIWVFLFSLILIFVIFLSKKESDASLVCKDKIERLKKDFDLAIKKFEESEDIRELEKSLNINFILAEDIIDNCNIETDKKNRILNHRDTINQIIKNIE